MPFPSKEIEEAYATATPFVQGYFTEEPWLHEVNGKIQPLYMQIVKRMERQTEEDLQYLLELMRELTEFERQHFFTEGWLMAKGEKRGERAK